ncbi:MAG: GNAT family N-acetyltransferase [Firmicutes bacterium]|nr:GNAT family N-acetyltransferase [Bacillota bacterium]
MQIRLETPRLVLITLDESFAPQVLDFFVRNREHLHPWEPARPPGFYQLEFQRRQLAFDQLKMSTGQLFKVWLFKKDDRDLEKVIGSVVVSEIMRGCFLSAFLGYRMDKGHQGQGLMTEAVGEVVRYAFDELGLHRLEANIMPRNKASLRVVEKLGFYEEGVGIKYLYINGRWEDHIHMVIRNPALEE